MLVETVCAVAGGVTLLLNWLNGTIERVRIERARQEIAIQDGKEMLTVEAYSAEFLLTKPEVEILNNRRSSYQKMAKVYARSQRRTEANPNWREIYNARSTNGRAAGRS